jgi:hypothetical protein
VGARDRREAEVRVGRGSPERSPFSVEGRRGVCAGSAGVRGLVSAEGPVCGREGIAVPVGRGSAELKSDAGADAGGPRRARRDGRRSGPARRGPALVAGRRRLCRPVWLRRCPAGAGRSRGRRRGRAARPGGRSQPARARARRRASTGGVGGSPVCAGWVRGRRRPASSSARRGARPRSEMPRSGGRVTWAETRSDCPPALTTEPVVLSGVLCAPVTRRTPTPSLRRNRTTNAPTRRTGRVCVPVGPPHGLHTVTARESNPNRSAAEGGSRGAGASPAPPARGVFLGRTLFMCRNPSEGGQAMRRSLLAGRASSRRAHNWGQNVPAKRSERYPSIL